MVTVRRHHNQLARIVHEVAAAPVVGAADPSARAEILRVLKA